MVSLKCPLCCNEQFTSTESLKAHVIDILINFKCPLCNEQIEKEENIYEHLNNCSVEADADEDVDNDARDIHESLVQVNLMEVLEHDAALNEIINDDNINERQESSNVSEDNMYYCELCSLEFDDIDEHMGLYHKGQTALLKGEDNEQQNSDAVLSEPELLNHTEETDKIPLKDKKIVKDPILQHYKLSNGEAHPISDSELASRISSDCVIALNKCPDCSLLFSELTQYRIHQCTVHGETNNTKRTRKKITLKNEIHQCGTCKTVLKTGRSLQLHKRMHAKKGTDAVIEQSNDTNEEVKTFNCNVCHKTYGTAFEESHMNAHNDHSNEYNCQVCNRKFYTESNLNMHMKAHTNNRKFFCSNCRQAFVTYEMLAQHTKNQCQPRPYACQYCGRRFTRPHEKVKHERIHTGEKPHICDICGKTFRVSYCLTLHLRTHSNARPYLCKVCGKRFKSHSVFNHHNLTHSDVRAYKCPFCPKSFKTSVQLAGHKNCHIKPFTCTTCNRPFASLYAVRAHMQSHEKKDTNNLKFQCYICGALYSRLFALRDHISHQHPSASEDPNIEAIFGKKTEDVEAADPMLDEDTETDVKLKDADIVAENGMDLT